MKINTSDNQRLTNIFQKSLLNICIYRKKVVSLHCLRKKTKIKNHINNLKLKIMKNHSLKSFQSYLQSMNCNVVDIMVSTEINVLTGRSYTNFAAIISAGAPSLYVVAYKFPLMSEPFIECTIRSFEECINVINVLLKH